MKIENLKEGMIIPNYRKLCNILKIKVVGGASKLSQLKEFSRFVKFHKEGHKYIIDKVYKEPLFFKNNRALKRYEPLKNS